MFWEAASSQAVKGKCRIETDKWYLSGRGAYDKERDVFGSEELLWTIYLEIRCLPEGCVSGQ